MQSPLRLQRGRPSTKPVTFHGASVLAMASRCNRALLFSYKTCPFLSQEHELARSNWCGTLLLSVADDVATADSTFCERRCLPTRWDERDAGHPSRSTQFAKRCTKGDYNPKSDNPKVAESEGAVHRGSLEEQWKCIIQASPKQADFSFGWKSLRFG